MKVLQIINSHAESAGGAEKLATQLHRGALEKGIDSHLLCLSRAPSDARDHIYSLGLSSAYHPQAFFRLVRFLRQRRFRDADVIHVHLFPAQLLFVLAARFLRLRATFITTEHNTFNRRRTLPGAKAVDRFTYRNYRKIVCISEGTRQTMQQWLPETAPKLTTIWNGINVSRYADLPVRSDASGREPIILSASRLTPQKNHAASLRAMKLLGERGFRFWIAGRGELEGALKAQTRELGLEDKVEFLGFRDDLPDLLSQADVFLSVSLWEGFGLSIVEAMAAGLPVVVGDVPGVAEVVGRDSGCGLFADPSSPGDIAARLEELLGNEELRAQMGANSRRRALFFDLQRMIEEYVQLYQEVNR